MLPLLRVAILFVLFIPGVIWYAMENHHRMETGPMLIYLACCSGVSFLTINLIHRSRKKRDKDNNLPNSWM